MRLLLLLFAVALSAVEEGPCPVLKVIDGDTIEVQREGKAERVRLLYVDTPECSDNAHGTCMPEGKAASEMLRKTLPVGTEVTLWGPAAALGRDRYDRLLATVTVNASRQAWHPVELQSVAGSLIAQGHSVYWRKYGDAAEPLHSLLAKWQEVSEQEKAGAWATAPEWMRDKANERTAPKVERAP